MGSTFVGSCQAGTQPTSTASQLAAECGCSVTRVAAMALARAGASALLLLIALLVARNHVVIMIEWPQEAALAPQGSSSALLQQLGDDREPRSGSNQGIVPVHRRGIPVSSAVARAEQRPSLRSPFVVGFVGEVEWQWRNKSYTAVAAFTSGNSLTFGVAVTALERSITSGLGDPALVDEFARRRRQSVARWLCVFVQDRCVGNATWSPRALRAPC